MTPPNYNKRENFTVSCIQICFNASKDIQRVCGHSKLEFIDIKTNITSILLSLHRFDKTLENKSEKNRQTNLQNRNKMAASSANVQKMGICIKSLKCSIWAYCIIKTELERYECSQQKGFKSHICRFDSETKGRAARNVMLY